MDYLGAFNKIHKGSCKRETRVSQSQGREVMIEAKVGVMHFKDRGSNYKPRNASGSSC